MGSGRGSDNVQVEREPVKVLAWMWRWNTAQNLTAQGSLLVREKVMIEMFFFAHPPIFQALLWPPHSCPKQP